MIDDISICDDEGYAKHDHLEDLRGDASLVLKKLNGYIKYLTDEGDRLAKKKGPTLSGNGHPISNGPFTND